MPKALAGARDDQPAARGAAPASAPGRADQRHVGVAVVRARPRSPAAAGRPGARLRGRPCGAADAVEQPRAASGAPGRRRPQVYGHSGWLALDALGARRGAPPGPAPMGRRLRQRSRTCSTVISRRRSASPTDLPGLLLQRQRQVDHAQAVQAQARRASGPSAARGTSRRAGDGLPDRVVGRPATLSTATACDRLRQRQQVAPDLQRRRAREVGLGPPGGGRDALVLRQPAVRRATIGAGSVCAVGRASAGSGRRAASRRRRRRHGDHRRVLDRRVGAQRRPRRPAARRSGPTAARSGLSRGRPARCCRRASIVARSPVAYQPSVQHLGGALGVLPVAAHDVRAVHQQPRRPAFSRTSTPRSGCPTLPSGVLPSAAPQAIDRRALAGAVALHDPHAQPLPEALRLGRQRRARPRPSAGAGRRACGGPARTGGAAPPAAGGSASGHQGAVDRRRQLRARSCSSSACPISVRSCGTATMWVMRCSGNTRTMSGPRRLGT